MKTNDFIKCHDSQKPKALNAFFYKTSVIDVKLTAKFHDFKK